MRLLQVCVCATLVANLPAPAQPRLGEAEVPAEQVKGRTIVLARGLATAIAPGPFWKWYSLGLVADGGAGMDGYLCRNTVDSTDFGYMLVVTKGEMEELDPATVDNFVRGVKKSTARSDMMLARPSYEPSDIPFPGSFRFRYEVVSSRLTGYLFGYIGKRGRGFVTQCITLSPLEPEDFTKFSASISAHAGAPVSKSKARGGFVVSLLAVGAGLVFWAVRRQAN